ncbi:MAG: Re/Si-specific NAD(P)(+) transhydrogenase subunit alpha [Candidatus Binataceae bacterium]|nr:Re/Si-specific NAD(P)(+) transhydrogenase subunit alpha [Candidatus Binataceae bacterium]
MRVGVPTETAAGENRVALVPDGVGRLVKAGLEVMVQAGAGARAHFNDDAYAKSGATLADAARVFAESDLLVKVRRPSFDEIKLIQPDRAIASLMQPASSGEIFGSLATARITALAMELVPRISAAQSLDVLSSQATIAGYKAVLIGAAAMSRMLPMMITAAGTLIPAKVFIIGAGVAGLQAIATSRRLGAVVSAFDVRAAARQEIESLGATFITKAEQPKDAEAAGGYARELKDDEARLILEAIGGHIHDQDLVISTAQIPGRPAPRLVTAQMVAAMRPGSVIVDLAAETGGNCELTKLGETVESNGVAIYGPSNIAATIPTHASQMYSRNIEAMLKLLVKDGQFNLDLQDRIIGPMVVTHQGEIRYGKSH